MKKILVTAACMSVFALAGCEISGSKSTINSQNELGFQMVSALNVYSMEQSTSQLTLRSGNYNKEDLVKYINLVDDFVNDGNFKTEIVESDRIDYQKRYNISLKDLSGEEKSYIMYYNETTTNIDYDDEEDDEFEQKIRLDGIALVGDEEFVISGLKEIENDKDETETKTSFRIYFDDEKKNYVNVVEETEVETDEVENEYKYQVYEDGISVNELSVSLENENDEREIEVKEKTTTSKKSYKYKYENKNGKDFMSVKVYENNQVIVDEKLEVIYDKENQQTLYIVQSTKEEIIIPDNNQDIV